jgi:hypothetical protein
MAEIVNLASSETPAGLIDVATRDGVMTLTLADAPSGFDWMPADEAGEAFPSVFRKALKLAR